MSDGSDDQRRALLPAVAAGVVIGVVLTTVVAVVVWPDEDERAGSADPAAVTVPVVPPATTPNAVPTTSSSTTGPEESDEPSADESSESSDEGDEPSEAALVADAAPAGQGSLPDDTAVTCPAVSVTVSDADSLTAALDAAVPGDVIQLDDGTYEGQFVTAASGTEQEPIYLCGSAEAVLDGGDVGKGYTFHLDGAQHWRLVGFTVSGGQKGVMADTTVGSVIQGLTVTGVGDEAIHLRDNSTDNVVLDNTVTGTGLNNEKYGEGVYIGSAVSNWCSYSDCEPDRSDRNVVKDNTISDTTSEAVDIKEGTTGGVVVGNTFDGSSLSGADSWVDVKGNNYLIQDNTGSHALEDGFQTHQILDGWGDFNVFDANTADVDSGGFAIASWPEESNVVLCTNTFTNAGEGLSNIPCT